MNKENNLYLHFVTALVNALKDDYFKASLVVKASFRSQFLKQINHLFTLEKEFECEIKNEKYALILAKTLANLIRTKTTIEKISKTNFDELDVAYIEYLTFVENETQLKKADLKKDITNLSPEYIKNLVDNFDIQQSDGILAKVEGVAAAGMGAGFVAGEATRPQAQVKRDEARPNNTNANTHTQAAGGMGAGGFNPYMAGGMPFMGPDFPVHPRFDARFYPFNKKLKWIPDWKLGLAIFTILSCAFLLIITLISRFSPINVGQVHVFTGGDHKGYIDGTGGAASGTRKTTLNFILSPSGVGLIAGLFAFIPGIWIGYSMLSTPKMPSHRYYMQPLTLGINIVFLAFTTYYLISFLLPNYIHDQIYNSIFGGTTPQKNDIAKRITDKITSSSLYKSIYTCTIISLTTTVINIGLLVASMIINPRIDQQKLLRANTEYQKAIQAKFQNQEYQIDPSIYDEELTEEYNQRQKDANNTV